MAEEADVVIIGAGLAGLVAGYELTRAGRRVLILDQENRANLGGQAFWSFGGLFLVGSPEQHRVGIRDSPDLAMADWMASAAFDRDREDRWPRQWARAYLEFAAGEKRSYLRGLGLRLLPNVGWAERGAGVAAGHGNSVPRFHIVWGTGPELVRIFRDPLLVGGLATFRFRHRVDGLIVSGGSVRGVRGSVLAPSGLPRGAASSREVAGEFEVRAQAVLVASGGIGGNLDLVRKYWPADRLGPPPASMVTGVPAHVDGRMLGIAEEAGASVVNRDRMWHYTEGVRNWDPVWPGHGIRILPGPSALWLDATGRRLPAPYLPGHDTLGTLAYIGRTGYDYSWFICTSTIAAKEFALSGSEQNPDLTGKDPRLLLRSRVARGATGPVRDFLEHGEDFVVRDSLHDLVAGMNAIAPGPALSAEVVEREVLARDRAVMNPFTKDLQLMSVRNGRAYWPDKVTRVARPHRFLDPEHGPLVAVRLHLLSRKTLGGLETTLDSAVLRPDGSVYGGLYAAGEAAGFGGGGMHGYNALEGTFLGGCVFSGRAAGRAIAAQLA